MLIISGYTVNEARPFRRRFRKIFRPPGVLDRTKNP